ncbi:MAG: tRNA (N(6)-L-threonylcarbamoyladenosine(37)-C(2))-methylthiotransferase MtaB [Gammaproteobacteria bacterium]
MQVYLKALGCRLNEAELEQWAQAFRQQGYGLASTPAEADLMVVNSCAVTAEAVRKSRHLLRQLQRHNPAGKLVVSGCFASLSPAEAAQLGADLVVSNQDKEQLVRLSCEAFDLPSAPMSATEPGESALFARERSRAFIKVQDGCRYQCTFCIVTVARGAERSRPIAEVVAEVQRLQAQGVQEVILSGVHLGGYGSDTGENLTALVRTVLQETAMPRVRLGSVEPWGLPPEFFELFSQPRLLPHLHLPLQSGSDQILRRMARRCKSADFVALVEQARRQIPDFNLSTDVIVGFPGETAADWQQTLALVESIGFGHLHIFPYSPRTGTRAADLAGQVDGVIKKQRVRELHTLGQAMKRSTLARYLGRRFEVLWESKQTAAPGGQVRRWGYTPNFLRVAVDVPPERELAHTIRLAELKAVDESGEFAQVSLLD